jgi:hypothetical protein
VAAPLWVLPVGLVRGLAAAMACIDFDAPRKRLLDRAALRRGFLVRGEIGPASPRLCVIAVTGENAGLSCTAAGCRASRALLA